MSESGTALARAKPAGKRYVDALAVKYVVKELAKRANAAKKAEAAQKRRDKDDEEVQNGGLASVDLRALNSKMGTLLEELEERLREEREGHGGGGEGEGGDGEPPSPLGVSSDCQIVRLLSSSSCSSLHVFCYHFL